MMNALQLSKTMQDAGMSEAQADALANGIDAYMRDMAATKADVHEVSNEVKVASARLETAIANSRNTIVFWVAGLLIAAVGINHLLSR
jgi:hypothetical protein